jgi:hypothetical protein
MLLNEPANASPYLLPAWHSAKADCDDDVDYYYYYYFFFCGTGA